jgi:tetraacyldisaccharide 4'-kinase
VKLLRILVFPISLIYGLITWLRNKLFDLGIFPVTEFRDIPLIGVGNLTVGGTGKTPHVEYLVKLLHPKYKIATLSRGYGRKTSGFLVAENSMTTLDIGDEPKQFRHRFPDDVPVAVDGNRVRGVKKLRGKYPDREVILLDDVFQHRRIKPGLQILLTDYSQLYYEDYILPTGNLREAKRGAKRADIIIVTKTPEMFSPLERKRIMKELCAEAYQKIYFSTIRYGNIIPLRGMEGLNEIPRDEIFNQGYSVFLMTGIANAHSLEYYLKDRVKELIPYKFRDHYEFSPADLLRLQELFNANKNERKIVLMTEKDAMRLEKPGLKEYIGTLPLYYIPIEIAFHDEAEDFNLQVTEYVRSHSINRKVSPGENERLRS